MFVLIIDKIVKMDYNIMFDNYSSGGWWLSANVLYSKRGGEMKAEKFILGIRKLGDKIDEVIGWPGDWLERRWEFLGWLWMFLVQLPVFIVLRVMLVFTPAFMVLGIGWIILLGYYDPRVYILVIEWIIIFFCWWRYAPKPWRKK